LRTGRSPGWAPSTIGSVILADRATRDLAWRAAVPSPLYSPREPGAEEGTGP
jgi:hypothetical protein